MTNRVEGDYKRNNRERRGRGGGSDNKITCMEQLTTRLQMEHTHE